jgi:hypothetical protein
MREGKNNSQQNENEAKSVGSIGENSNNLSQVSNNPQIRTSAAEVVNSKLTSESELTGKADTNPNINNSYSIIPEEPIDPRQSVDFSNKFNQRYPDHIQQSFDIGRSIYNPSMSTLRFMNEIDLRCDDHLLKSKEDIMATRFCSDCKILCCDSCVIEFHHSHIASAKTKVEDYFKKQKNEMEDLKSKLNSAIKHKTVLTELQVTLDTHERSISNYFLKRRSYLESLKNKLDTLLIEDSELANKIKETVHCFYRDEGYKRIEKPLKDMEDLLNKIQYFIRDWEMCNRADKARALKQDTLCQLRNDSCELDETVRKQVEVFKGKSRSLEKNLTDLFKNFSYNDKINDMETILLDISGKIKNSFASVIKLNYDDIAIDNNKDDNLFNIIQDNIPIVVHQNVANPIKNQPSVPSNQANIQRYEQNHVNPPYNQNNKPDNFNFENKFSNNNYPNLQESQPRFPINESKQSDNSSFVSVNKNNELIIGIKQKSDEIIVFDPKRNVFSPVKIARNHFNDKSKMFATFPDNCRYVNLYSSILITGGYINRQVTSNSYILVLSGDYGSYDISIIPYANMIEARERHNMISLHDRNMILVCSGFFNKNVEITDLNVGTWSKIAQLSDTRANATIAYINRKNVLIFGGFKINDKQVGEYQNSYEVLNMDQIDAGWKLVNFDTFGSIKLSAMGVINLSDNSLLLCGGYDGSQYKTEVNRIEFDDVMVKKYEKVNNLPSNLIFIHNSFVRVDECAYNFDLNMNTVIYNPKDNGFKVISYNLDAVCGKVT